MVGMLIGMTKLLEQNFKCTCEVRKKIYFHLNNLQERKIQLNLSPNFLMLAKVTHILDEPMIASLHTVCTIVSHYYFCL